MKISIHLIISIQLCVFNFICCHTSHVYTIDNSQLKIVRNKCHKDYFLISSGKIIFKVDSIDECLIELQKEGVASAINKLELSLMPEEKILYALNHSDSLNFILNKIVKEEFRYLNEVLRVINLEIDDKNINNFLIWGKVFSELDTNTIFLKNDSLLSIWVDKRYKNIAKNYPVDYLHLPDSLFSEDIFIRENIKRLEAFSKQKKGKFLLCRLGYNPSIDRYYSVNMGSKANGVPFINIQQINPYASVSRFAVNRNNSLIK